MKKLKDFPVGTIIYSYTSKCTYCLLEKKANLFYILELKPNIISNKSWYLYDDYEEGDAFKVVGYTKIITI